MEKVYENVNIPSFFVDLFSLHIVLDLLYSITSFIVSHWVLLRCQLQPSKDFEEKCKQSNKSYSSEKKPISCYDKVRDNECCLIGQDINVVMERLGIQCSLEGEELKKIWGREEISNIFKDEPSLQEVREAFNVFDRNGDGFIDAGELQRVLCGLGLGQGSELQTCREMSRAVNGNGADKIDFKEFAKFMEENF